jgi:hypothetical protein
MRAHPEFLTPDFYSQAPMRPRTPSIIWIPFIFSVGTISWALLVAGLVILSAVIVAPPLRDVRTVEAQRNDLRATVDLLDQKIALQQDFMKAAQKDPLLMERLASRQLHLNRPDQEVLPLDPDAAYRDRSVNTLIAESLTPVTPQPVKPLPWFLEATLNTGVRPLLVIVACAALTLSFFLGVRYQR